MVWQSYEVCLSKIDPCRALDENFENQMGYREMTQKLTTFAMHMDAS